MFISPDEVKDKIIYFLNDKISIFVWSTADMKGIDPFITTQKLNVYPTIKPTRRKIRKLGPKWSKVVDDEVERLLSEG